MFIFRPVNILMVVNLLNVGVAIDLTRVPEAYGANVVSATVALIQRSGIFPCDSRIIRRLAYAESRDGEDLRTFRRGYNGGIWQVDEEIFQETLNLVQAEEFKEIEERIYRSFSIRWHSVEWAELRIPLYSALAASIFFAHISIPNSGDVIGQARLWKSSAYNRDSRDTVDSFVTLVNNLEQRHEQRSE